MKYGYILQLLSLTCHFLRLLTYAYKVGKHCQNQHEVRMSYCGSIDVVVVVIVVVLSDKQYKQL